MRALIAFAAVWLCQTAAFSQAIPDQSHINGKSHAPVPRFSRHYANVLTVPANTTVTLPTSHDIDVVEVSGVLKVSRTASTTGRILHLQILPGGHFDEGTEADPIPANITVDIAIKNVHLSTGTASAPGIDPEQFGNGVNNFGNWTIFGREVRPAWTTCQELQAGALTLTVTETHNWRVGDELLIPDTRQMVGFPYGQQDAGTRREPRREAPVKIAAVNGNVLTLSKPLDFEHLAFSRPDGSLVSLPFVANLTRNVVLRSEDPLGTRGHVMHMDTGHVDFAFGAILDMGRTTADKIHNTFIDPNEPSRNVIGTNQIARYNDHDHHVHGHADAQDRSNKRRGMVYSGSGKSKWGRVQHGTHYSWDKDNIAYDFHGGGFVTEDGYERFGTYDHCLAAYVTGRRDADGKQFLLPELFAPGAEGAGFWWHSSVQTITGCLAINCEIGHQFLNLSQVTGRKVPSAPGGPNDTDFDPTTGVPVAFTGNISSSNMQTGLESWEQRGWTALDCDLWHNGQQAVLFGVGQGGSIKMDRSRLINHVEEDGTYAGIGMNSTAAYHGTAAVIRSEVRGFAVGMKDARFRTDVTGSALQNELNLNFQEALPEAFLSAGLRLEALPPPAVTTNMLPPDAFPLPPDNPPPVNNPPVVSPITVTPPAPVYTQTPITYSYTVSDPDGDAVAVEIFYSANGGPRTKYTGPQQPGSWQFIYPAPVEYVWTVVATDSKGATAESRLTVQVIARPVEPPTPPPSSGDALVRQLLKDIADLIKARLP